MLTAASDAATVLQTRPRYAREWGQEFWEHVDARLAGARAVLDVGGGRRPTIDPGQRPTGVEYVGLDPSASELALAPSGSYDEVVAAAAEDYVPALVARFDLIVSWQVLEHVRALPRVAANFHAYLRPGGVQVSCLSGRNAVYALANRVLPVDFAGQLVARLRNRPRDTVFPAYYDHCDRRGLESAFATYESVQVISLWRGGDYFERSELALRVYLRYEDLAIARGWDNLATNYVVVAHKGGGPT